MAWSLPMLLAISLLLAAQRADDRGAASTPSQPGHGRCRVRRPGAVNDEHAAARLMIRHRATSG